MAPGVTSGVSKKTYQSIENFETNKLDIKGEKKKVKEP